MKEQFQRIAALIGEENASILQHKCVAIAGVGAVGGFACEMIARSGIGRIRIADFDVYEESNINRQIGALHSTIGRKKVDVMKERILDINPDCIVETLPEFIDASNIDAFLSNVDILLDCIDSVSAKAELLRISYERSIPVISSMGAALRKHSDEIRTGDIMDTFGCPLAKEIRSRLRKMGIGRGIECVFSPEKVEFTYRETETEVTGRKHLILGSMPYVTAIFGEKIAELALRKLLPEEVI